MKEKKGLMVLGIGALLGGLFLLFRKGKPALAEPPPNGIVVGLWNPPSQANKWQLSIGGMTAGELYGLSWGVNDHDNINEAAVFEIPDWWVIDDSPIRVLGLAIYREWQEDGQWHSQQLYAMQSMWEEYPDYKDIYIPGYGSYYYNVSKERFEKA